MTPADLARRLFRDQCRHNDLSSYGERAAVAAMVPLIEALQPFANVTEGEVYERFVAENRHTFRLTNGDGSRTLTFINAECFDYARAALTPQPEEVA